MLGRFAIFLIFVAALSFLTMPEVVSGQYGEAWKALAPNFVGSSLSLLVAVTFAEVFLRYARQTESVDIIRPRLRRRLLPIVRTMKSIIRGTNYSGKEFYEHYMHYADTHAVMAIPPDVVARLNTSIRAIPLAALQAATIAFSQTAELAAGWSAIFHRDYHLMLDGAADDWEALMKTLTDKNAEPELIAKSIFDTYETLLAVEDVFELFGEHK